MNVQCIVDHRKKVLWARYNSKGASHDSTCFKDSDLYQRLLSISDKLYQKERFILGDSAYGIESFLIPPYDTPFSKTPEDDFNYYHSSARITVECAFGEISLRWGIFWKKLSSSIETNIMVCEAAMQLHNFLVEYRERHNVDLEYENTVFRTDCSDVGLYSQVIANDDCRVGGRISIQNLCSRRKGLFLRDKLKINLAEAGLHRPIIE